MHGICNDRMKMKGFVIVYDYLQAKLSVGLVEFVSVSQTMQMTTHSALLSEERPALSLDMNILCPRHTHEKRTRPAHFTRYTSTKCFTFSIVCSYISCKF